MRIFLFMILIGVVFIAPFPVVCVGALLYAFRYVAYELIVLGALVDALYGTGMFPYLYTLGATGIFVFAELVKPSLSFYDSAA